MNINPKDIMDWCSSPRGKLVLTLVTVVIFAGVFAYYFKTNNTKTEREKGESKKTPSLFTTDDVHETGVNYDIVNKESAPPEKTPDKSTPPAKVEDSRTQNVATPPQRISSNPPPIVNVYAKAGSKSVDLSDRFAPYGRLIPCQLVLTIDSAFAETPIVALVTENVWHAGKLVIPASAEVHGRAIAKPVRDRIMTEKDWVIVWRTRDEDNGKELRVKGLALTKEEMLSENSWHLHDGSAGIRGEIIQSSEMQKLMAYAADFIATFTDNLTQKSVTITDWGQTTTKSGNVRDAVNEGVASAVRKYADKLLQQIENEGYFVRCAGGTVFYLYVTDVINMNDAQIAGTLAKNQK